MGRIKDLWCDKAEEISKKTGLSFDTVVQIWSDYKPDTDEEWEELCEDYIIRKIILSMKEGDSDGSD